MSDRDSIDRRKFLKAVGIGAGLGLSLPMSFSEIAAADVTERTRPPYMRKRRRVEKLPKERFGYVFLTDAEAAFLNAAVDTLIPADELGPGASEAGVVRFIDRQLAGAFGAGEKMYMQGPWIEGTPQQGYQSPLVPRDLYREAIAEIQEICAKRFQKGFESLGTEQRVTVMKDLESAKIALNRVKSKDFFGLLLANAMEGYFADPVYGGNRGKSSWKMLGYPGAVAFYSDAISEYHNRDYGAETKSIEDLS